MKLSYFGYYLRDINQDDSYLIDLRAFVEEFVASGNSPLKAGLSHNGESLYLLPLAKPVYLFVQARDREIIKAIEKKKLSVEDIQKRLEANESVGFASYVLMEKHWLAVGCRVLSPRINAFASFMTQILAKTDSPYEFVPKVLTHKIPKSMVKKLHHVGAVSLEMDMSNSIGRDVINTLTGGAHQATADISEIQIRITPVRTGKKSLSETLKAVLHTVPDDGLESLEARAQVEMTDRIADVYIVGEGGLRDSIKSRKESAIPQAINQTAAANQTLIEKVKEFERNDNFKKVGNLSSLGLAGKFSGWKSRRVAKARNR